MTDRPGDDDPSASDWLASQFSADDAAEDADAPPDPAPEPPIPATGRPGRRTAPPAPAEAPPTAWPLVNPFGAGDPAPRPEPDVPTVPPPAATAPPTAPAPAPAVPPTVLPPVPPSPTTPPVTTPPVTTAPPAAAAGGFAWGLKPGAGEASAPAASTPPPAGPPTTPPALVEPPASWTPPPVEPSLDGAGAPASPPAEPLPFETARLPEVAPDAADATGWDQPTQLMMSLSGTIPPVAPPISDAAAADLTATEMLGSAAMAHDPGTASALDALFGEQNFRDYDAEPAAGQSPFTRAAVDPVAAPASGQDDADRAAFGRTQKVLLWVVGGLVAILALVALFLLGTRLPSILGPAPAVSPTPSESASPSPSPSPTVEPVGPVAVGVWEWDELRGGECLNPYTDPWSEEFTVVDCAAPHPGQMVFRGTFPPSAEGVTDDPYPGADALQQQISLLCGAPGVVNLAAAGQYPDVQVQGTFPATQEQWDAGERHYYCFVSRSSGEPLTGSVAVPPAPAA